MLAAGAVSGLVAGVLALGTISGVSDDIRSLAQLAMLLPVGIFVAWWLLVPGMALDRDERSPIEDEIFDVEARVQQIQVAFDASAQPHTGGHPVAPSDESVRDELRRSIRRPVGSERAAATNYGIRRERRDLG